MILPAICDCSILTATSDCLKYLLFITGLNSACGVIAVSVQDQCDNCGIGSVFRSPATMKIIMKTNYGGLPQERTIP